MSVGLYGFLDKDEDQIKDFSSEISKAKFDY